MSALTDRIYGLLRKGHDIFEIADVVGLTPTQISDRLKDPTLADPTSGTGIVGGGGGGGGAFRSAVVTIAGIGQNTLNPTAEDGETGLVYSAANLTAWTVSDDIGLIAEHPATGTDYIGLPTGVFRLSAIVEGFSPDLGHYAVDEVTDATMARTRFKAASLALEASSRPGQTNPSIPSLVSNTVVMNGRQSGNLGGMSVGPFLLDAREALTDIDPVFEGLFGWTRLTRLAVNRLDGTERINTLDGHTYSTVVTTIEQIA